MFTHVFESAKTDAEIKETTAKVVDAIKAKEILLEKVSIRDVAEATLGVDGLRKMAQSSNEVSFHMVQEAVAPVNLSAFTNITGQLVLQGVYDAYSAPEYIAEKLVTVEASREDNTRTPGLQEIDADAMEVEEGAEYPDVKFNEDYINVPQSKKRGMKIGITREMVFFDRTGMVLEMARSVGENLALNKERRIMDVVLGITNTYVRKGVARNTYVSATDNANDPRINKITQALTDWNSFDVALQTFEAMSNDSTGEAKRPIIVQPKVVLVTQAKWMTARNIVGATQIRVGGATTAANTQTYANSPVDQYEVITSPWIKRRLVQSGVAASNADKNWLIGDPKRAFRYRQLFPLQVIAAQHDKDAFDRDVIAQFRADERGVAYAYAPWYMLLANEG